MRLTCPHCKKYVFETQDENLWDELFDEIQYLCPKCHNTSILEYDESYDDSGEYQHWSLTKDL